MTNSGTWLLPTRLTNTSGLAREDESALYWIEAQAGWANNGLGARLSADWRSGTRVDRGRLGQPVDAPPARTSAADEVVKAARALAGDAPMGSHHLLEALVRAPEPRGMPPTDDLRDVAFIAIAGR